MTDTKREGLPTSKDPHPANEEKYDRQRHPGGANPPRNDLGPNNAIHDGTPKPRPDNAS